jgi:hypothetical protein
VKETPIPGIPVEYYKPPLPKPKLVTLGWICRSRSAKDGWKTRRLNIKRRARVIKA